MSCRLGAIKDEDMELGKAAMAQQQRRKGGIGTKEWIVISQSGDSHIEEAGKQSIMKRTGLPARDLRALDPALSNLSTILSRERAIVINLEHIKAIVTAKEMLMVKSTNPLVAQFIHDLQERVSSKRDVPVSNNEDGNSSRRGLLAGQKTLPFEFHVLEACLESACRCLESETQTLEQEAYPALDELSSKISTLNLERVRQIKSRLVEISGRVQKVRDELEHLLDDDIDMAEMYLTKKFHSQSREQTPTRERHELHNEDLESDTERDEENKSEYNSEAYTTVKPNVEELEMLLEAYFAQIDGISQKLFNMKEYVDDTEDFINIMLDDKQNQMLQLGVVLNTANLVLNGGVVVFGIFGMNFKDLPLFNLPPSDAFWQTTTGTTAACSFMFILAYGWLKYQRLV